MYYASHGAEIPKQFQLQAALASKRGNSLVVAGTGFGKMHIMALLMLLEKSDSTRVFITISPLKRLQAMQACNLFSCKVWHKIQVTSFLAKYGINTVAVNQDTPQNKEYWKKNIYNGAINSSQIGTAQHLIYLQIAHDDFTWLDGPCRILCATSGESVGIDFSDVRITVNVGVVDESESDQRKGRGDRDQRGGLHVTLYETWVLDVKLEEFDDTTTPFHSDPNRPCTILRLGLNKREHVPRSGIAAILAPCIRQYKANYLSNSSLSCIDYRDFCCDGSAHINNQFRLQEHLPGTIYVAVAEPKPKPTKRKALDKPVANLQEQDTEDGVKICIPRHRTPLKERLLCWRRAEHERDPISGVVPEYMIIMDCDLATLCKIHLIYLHSPMDLVAALDEEVDGDFAVLWASGIYQVINAFDMAYPVQVCTNKRKRKT
ncbi:hypothetical protein BDP27DRAFT_1426790 [Rhodocollybia butyracea]|uniref:Helicase C-terminal domain-containing protein n=1 Tax=Rhodocollybia butyracea TaxID=206335 RepID=A0A9P5PJ24_9AGAR|nr:hypothetical protein BDP27DRAFT_1426790 [Rhodocollybia butyracea]